MTRRPRRRITSRSPRRWSPARTASADPRWSPGGEPARLDRQLRRSHRPRGRGRPTARRRPPWSPPTARSGGGWCWAGDDEVVVVAGDGRLVAIALDGGAAPRVAQPRRPRDRARGVGARRGRVRDRARRRVRHRGRAARRLGVAGRVSHADYAWDPAWSPDGSMLAWHEWDLPDMPWDASRRRDPATCNGEAEGRVKHRRRRGRREPAALLARRRAARVHLRRRRLARVVGRRCRRRERAPGARRAARARGAGVGTGSTFVRVVARRHRARVVPQRRRLRPARDRARRASARRASSRRAGTAASTGARAGSRACARARSRRRRWWCSRRTARAGARSRAGRSAASRRPVWSSPRAVTWKSGSATVHGLLWRPADAAPPTGARGRCSCSCTAGRPARRSPTGRRRSRRSCSAAGRCCSPTTAARRATAARTRRRSPATGASGTSPTSRPGSVTPRRRAGPTRTRVAIMGGSAGGMTVLLVAAQHPDLVQAVVARYPGVRPRRPRRDHAPLRVGLHAAARRAAARRGRHLPRSVADLARGRDPRAGAAAARRRRHVGAARAVGGGRRRVARGGRDRRAARVRRRRARLAARRRRSPTTSSGSTRSWPAGCSRVECRDGDGSRRRVSGPEARRRSRGVARARRGRRHARGRADRRRRRARRRDASRRCASTSRTGGRAGARPTGRRCSLAAVREAAAELARRAKLPARTAGARRPFDGRPHLLDGRRPTTTIRCPRSGSRCSAIRCIRPGKPETLAGRALPAADDAGAVRERDRATRSGRPPS